MPRNAGLSVADAKRKVIDAIGSGLSRADAMKLVGRTVKTFENWQSEDKDFAAKIAEVRSQRERALAGGKDESVYQLGFAEWRKRFLGMETYPHQQQWVDLLEGREPVIHHPSITYEPGNARRLLINTPPFHCATVDTPVFTQEGWKTVGEVTEDDFLVGAEGLFWPVYDTWTPESEVPIFEVEFETGDVIKTDAGHLWAVTKTMTGAQAELTTEQLMDDLRWPNGVCKWKVPVTPSHEGSDAPLPIDPYLLGYWLGDGDTAASRLSVSDEDRPALLAELDSLGLTYSVGRDSRGGGSSVYVHKIRRLLPLGEKRIPAAYFQAGHKERLALLQGLMDTDGTINPKDGRANFIQVKDDLTRDVYRLIAGLGFKVSWKREKQNPVAPNGVASGPTINRLYFKPNGDPVFRLERKLRHQKVTTSRCKTGFRTIRDIRPAGMGNVRCISVASSGNLYALGDGMILTHNAKSTVLTQHYVAYRICMNPEIRVVIVSKTQKQAAKYLYSVKRILTERQFAELHAAYAPPGGFKPERNEGSVWARTMIYVAGRGDDAIDPAGKDPTVEAIGIGGQLQGARADLIIIDDCEDPGNVGQWENHLDWINEVVQSRLYSGKIVVVGTRVAPTDIFSALRDGSNFLSGKSPWTYLGQPCVLEFAEDPADWVTLWPRSTVPLDVEDEEKIEPDENGLYPTWDGPALARIREGIKPRSWALLYMQQPIGDDATFNPACVNGSVDRRRKPGPLRVGEWGGRREGAQGVHTVLSIDPAGTGEAFMLAYAVDRTPNPATGDMDRWVLNAWMGNHTTPDWYADQIEAIVPEYGVNEIVVESNGYANWIIHYKRIVNYCRNRGIPIMPHYTSHNKQDPDFGVASMAPLFGTVRRHVEGGREVFNRDNAIHLPDPDKSAGVKALIEQLVSWQPGKLGKNLRMDGPMALWFAELRARAMVTNASGQQHYLPSRFMARGRSRSRWIEPLHT